MIPAPHRRLSHELQRVGEPVLAADALLGRYGDQSSPLVLPKSTLIRRLYDLGHDELARRIGSGEFDD